MSKPRDLTSSGLLIAHIVGDRPVDAYIYVHDWLCNEHGARRLANWLGRAGAWLAQSSEPPK